MNQTLDCPVLGLDNDFPDEVIVLYYSEVKKWACYTFDGVSGLACFSSKVSANRFESWIDIRNPEQKVVSFDEAREIAKSRPPLISSLMLCDNPDNPKVHYIR